jgi:hypothetical protein
MIRLNPFIFFQEGEFERPGATAQKLPGERRTAKRGRRGRADKLLIIK